MISDGTQTARILNLLAASWPSWTPAPALARISLQYCARISELRERGWEISNRTEYKAGVRHGFYRLGSPPVPSSRELRANRTETKPMEPGSLFDDSHFDLG
jgi:Helix-turn-helix domain